MPALERSSALRYQEREREEIVRNNLRALTNEECQTPGLCKDEIRKIKSQLELTDQGTYHGTLIIELAEKMLFGEAPTKRMLGSEKRYGGKKHTAKIEKDRMVSRDEAGIERAFKEHYEALFTLHAMDMGKLKHNFLDLIRLEDEIKANPQAPLTVIDVK